MERKRRKAIRKPRGKVASEGHSVSDGVILEPEIEDAEARDPLIEVGAEEPLAGLDDPEDLSEVILPDHAHAALGSGSSDSGAREEGGALVPLDPLSHYLAEIRRFPLLSREDELVISRRYHEHHDPQDAYRLVTANLRLVVKIAYEFARASRNLLDMIQEGNVGLMEAVKNFDPNRGIRFPSYAVWWVRAYIYRFLINNWRLVKIGTTQAQRKLFFNLRKEMDRLEAEGFSPQPKMLAQRLGVKESEVVEMQERLGHSEMSIDRPVSNNTDDETRLLDILPDTVHNPEEETAQTQFRNFAHHRIEEFATRLSGKELEIFRHRLLAEEPLTLQEMGEKFGISRERVRQIESRLKRQLKEFVISGAPDIEQIRQS